MKAICNFIKFCNNEQRIILLPRNIIFLLYDVLKEELNSCIYIALNGLYDMLVAGEEYAII